MEKRALIKRIRFAIWVLQMAILCGSLAVWILKPTGTYWRRWLPRIRATTDTTYFGLQGSALLVHAFPVLLLAVLSCGYLHLGTKLEDPGGFGRRRRWVRLWRRAVTVRGPLGIVSGTEVVFLVMFIALLAWSFGSRLHFVYAKYITPQSLARRKETLWQARLGRASEWLGGVGNVCLVFLFFPVSRRSPVLGMFGLTSEGSIKYHIWVGHLAMLLFTAHGIGYIYYWAATHRLHQVLKWANTGASNIAGELSLAAGLVLWATTIPGVRHRCFELFFYTHHFYVPFLIFFVFHLGIDYAIMMLPGLYLFLLDRFLRFLQSRQRIRLLYARILPCDAMELGFSKSPDLVYNPTSIVFINVPSISKLQWHPYTISSSSRLETEQLSVIVKSQGCWSHKLNQIISSSPVHLQVAIEGPYGPVSTHFLRHDVLVMVSGGSGIAPFISIIREIIFSASTAAVPSKLLLISAFKNAAGLAMLDLLLPVSAHGSVNPNAELRIEAFVTRDKESMAEEDPKSIRTVWFKPKVHAAADGEPISDVLGPNGWLLIGTIIASSFVAYLILIGILTRFYIFPIDHNSFNVYSESATAALNMAVMCACLAAGATGAVLWNKKQSAVKAKSVPYRELMAPAPSTGILHQSIAQCTRVHHGERPDLKRMVEECRGRSAGVMVCGPKKMRQEVAAICSSSSANNLHFESISFSW